MEPVTHFLSGAILSRAGFNRKTAYATLAMTLAAEMPDIDVLWSVRGPLAGFQHHRGLTHTFLGAPFEAGILTALIWSMDQLRRKKPHQQPKWHLLWAFSTLAILLHILLDFTNNYGVRPLFPFSPDWHAWSIVFIVDPFLLLALTAGLVLPAIFGLTDREISNRRVLFRGQGLAITTLILIGLYYGWRGTEQAHALNLVRQAGVGGAPMQRLTAEPYPFSPFHWHAIVETANCYQTADVSTWTNIVNTSDANDRIPKPPVTPAVASAKKSWLGQVYLNWSLWPVTRDAGGELPPEYANDPGAPAILNRIDFEDLRFAYSAIPGGNEGRAPLGASAYVAPDGQIEAIYMGDKPQK